MTQEMEELAERAMHPAVKYLGKKVKEVTSGFTGIANVVVQELNGNIRVSIQPPMKKNEDKLPDAYSFDDVTIDIVDKGFSDRVIEPNLYPEFEIGDKVKDSTSGFTGFVIGYQWHMNGCLFYNLEGDKIPEQTGKPVLISSHGETLKKMAVKKEVKDAVQTAKPTGGPPMKVDRR